MLIDETPSIIVIILIIALEPLIEEIRNQRATSGRHAIKLHHDNAKAHMHKHVGNYLQSERYQNYSPTSKFSRGCTMRFLVIRSG